MRSPSRRHDATVTSYSYFADPWQRLTWEWFCTCGDLHSGYISEDAAELGAIEHVETADNPELAHGGWGVALLAIGTAGWVAGAVFAVIMLVVVVLLARSCRPVEPPPWIIRSASGRTRIVEPDPDALWGDLSTQQRAPHEGEQLRVPGYTWEWVDGKWRRL